MKLNYSTHEVAKLCGVTPMTVIRWIDEGKLKAVRTPGGHRRVMPADLGPFLAERGVELPPGEKGVAVALAWEDANAAADHLSLAAANTADERDKAALVRVVQALNKAGA